MKLIIRRRTISVDEVVVVVNVEMSDDEVLQFRNKYVYVPYLAKEISATLPQGLYIECNRNEVEELENRIAEELREAYLELKLVMYEDERYSRVVQL